MKRVIIPIVLLMAAIWIVACNPMKTTMRETREIKIFDKSEYTIFYILNEDGSSVKRSASAEYYWYFNNKIHITQGDFSGRLLHGSYIEYYGTDNLKCKGNYRYGLKEGRWQEWYPNGNYSRVADWERGALDGDVILYDDEGNVTTIEHYKDGLLHGRQMYPDSLGNPMYVKYRHGQMK